MSIEVGNILEGVVTGITKFGAFVELPGGKVGLVHISEVADVYVKDVHDFLKEKDKVKVKVLSIDDHGKIGLSIKQAQEKKKNLKLIVNIIAALHNKGKIILLTNSIIMIFADIIAVLLLKTSCPNS